MRFTLRPAELFFETLRELLAGAGRQATIAHTPRQITPLTMNQPTTVGSSARHRRPVGERSWHQRNQNKQPAIPNQSRRVVQSRGRRSDSRSTRTCAVTSSKRLDRRQIAHHEDDQHHPVEVDRDAVDHQVHDAEVVDPETSAAYGEKRAAGGRAMVWPMTSGSRIQCGNGRACFLRSWWRARAFPLEVRPSDCQAGLEVVQSVSVMRFIG